jgi:hypothetical protein
MPITTSTNPTACACYGTAQDVYSPTLTSAYRWINSPMNWTCGFTCCSQNPPSNITYSSSRLARIDTDQKAAFLSTYTALAASGSWIGLYAPVGGSYFWYDDPLTQNGGPYIQPSEVCTSCSSDSYFPQGGYVVLRFVGSQASFDNDESRYLNRWHSILCECKHF